MNPKPMSTTEVTALGLPVRTVCASNLSFVRSRDKSALANASQLERQCWPVHQFILDLVQPVGVLSIGGGKVFQFVARQGRLVSPPETFPSGHGDWACIAAKVQLGAKTMALVSVPHLARYAIDAHPDVIRWIGEKLRP